jgi:hypothetical protein
MFALKDATPGGGVAGRGGNATPPAAAACQACPCLQGLDGPVGVHPSVNEPTPPQRVCPDS